jgi:CubicO group peptidase (beta-lactamase class C family)
MFKPHRFFLLPLILAAVSQSLLAHQQKTDFSKLELTAVEELRKTNTPGVAIAIIKGDRVEFAKTLGVSNIETGAPLTTETLFRIASNTKVLTAAALVTLAENGKIKLNEPIGAYVKGLSPKLSQLTLHQLLSHTAGMRDGASDFGLHDDSSLGTFIRTWTDDYLFTEPDRIFSYSNLGYDLAGLVLEEVTGKPYADAMDEVLFKPLGMNRTTLRPLMAVTYPFATGHKIGENGKPVVVRPMADEVREWPSGGVFTNVMDYARFAIAFLNQGRLDGKQVLSPEMIAKLSTPYSNKPGNNDQQHAQYGYGLNIVNYRGLRVLQHSGSIAGFGALLRIVPEQRFAIIILTNRTGALFTKTMDEATEMAGTLTPEPRVEAPKPLPMNDAERARYVGTYRNSPTYLGVEILQKDGNLFLRQIGANDMSPIIKIGDNKFSSGGDEFVLIPGKDNKIEFLYIVGHALKKVQAGM